MCLIPKDQLSCSRNSKSILRRRCRLVGLLNTKSWRMASYTPLQLTAKALPRLDEDSRLVPILSNLSQGFLAGAPSEWAGASDAADADTITADMIDELAQKHFPLCMRNLHRELRATDHLKHFGRLQYGLFLKVIFSPL